VTLSLATKGILGRSIGLASHGYLTSTAILRGPSAGIISATISLASAQLHANMTDVSPKLSATMTPISGLYASIKEKP
jgi:hypothetical protein